VDIPMGVTGLLGEGGLYQCRIRLPSYEILSMALSLSMYSQDQFILKKFSEVAQKNIKKQRKTFSENRTPNQKSQKEHFP